MARPDNLSQIRGSTTARAGSPESGPHACQLRELDLARDIARRLRSELIYGMPDEAQAYKEDDVPTSLNLPMFMEFVFKVITGREDPGGLYE
jgi:hypothetical protein